MDMNLWNDLYIKTMLTIIAVCSVFILVKIYEEKPKVLTVRDLYDLRQEKDKELAKKKAIEIRLNTPIVTVQGGTISVE